jgi:hypothetical protein
MYVIDVGGPMPSGFGGLTFLTPVLGRVSQKECARFREVVPYVKKCGYNPKHRCPKLNSYEDNGQRNLKL